MGEWEERLRREAQRMMDDAFRNGFRGGRDAGYTADRFFYDEAGTVPEQDGPPKVGAVLLSLARAKGLLPSPDQKRRVGYFNSVQRKPGGSSTVDVPCTVIH